MVIDATILGALAMSALVFGFAYFPIVTHLAHGLVSQYTKADVRRRLNAAATDGGLVITGFVLYQTTGMLAFLLAAAVYLVLRDSFNGQSVGKLLFGLVVLSLETGRPATAMTSLRRNGLFLLPGANVAAVFLESITLIRDKQGQRLGDRLAQTQVVDGLGAKDVVDEFAKWWSRSLPEVTRAARPGRKPGLTVGPSEHLHQQTQKKKGRPVRAAP
jgi:uncharacterized RDD family membrane protein YckC